MKIKKIMCLISCCVLCLMGGFLSLNAKPVEVKANTERNTTYKWAGATNPVYFGGDVYVPATEIPDGNKLVMEFEIVNFSIYDTDASQNEKVTLAFSLDSSFGSSGSNGFTMNPYEDGQTQVGAFGTNPKINDLSWEYRLLGADWNGRTIVSGSNYANVWCNFSPLDVASAKNNGAKYVVKCIFDFVGMDLEIKAPNQWGVEQSTIKYMDELTIDATNYYPVINYQAHHENDVFEIDNYKVYSIDASGNVVKNYSGTDFDRQDVCYGWQFSSSVCSATSFRGEYIAHGDTIDLTLDQTGIRIDKDAGAMRFRTLYNQAELDALTLAYGAENVEVGHIIIPHNVMYTKDKSTYNGYGTANLITADTKNVIISKAENFYDGAYTSVLVDTPYVKNAWDVCVRSYLKITENGKDFYYYGGQISKSLTSVATDAYNELSDTKQGEFIYSVGDKFSKYTSIQRGILDYLITPEFQFSAVTDIHFSLTRQDSAYPAPKYSLKKMHRMLEETTDSEFFLQLGDFVDNFDRGSDGNYRTFIGEKVLEVFEQHGFNNYNGTGEGYVEGNRMVYHVLGNHEACTHYKTELTQFVPYNEEVGANVYSFSHKGTLFLAIDALFQFGTLYDDPKTINTVQSIGKGTEAEDPGNWFTIPDPVINWAKEVIDSYNGNFNGIVWFSHINYVNIDSTSRTKLLNTLSSYGVPVSGFDGHSHVEQEKHFTTADGYGANIDNWNLPSLVGGSKSANPEQYIYYNVVMNNGVATVTPMMENTVDITDGVYEWHFTI